MTLEELRRIRISYPFDANFLFVVHVDIDRDCVAPVQVFCEANEVDIRSDRVTYMFVSHGMTYDGESNGRIVIHCDTGRRLDPENGFFDHHFVGCPVHSATHAMVEVFYSHRSYIPPHIIEIRDYVNLVDSKIGRMTGENYELVKQLGRVAKRLTNGTGRFVPAQFGIEYLEKVIRQLPEGTSDYFKMIVGLSVLQGYIDNYEKINTRDRLADLREVVVEDPVCQEYENENMIQFLKLEPLMAINDRVDEAYPSRMSINQRLPIGQMMQVLHTYIIVPDKIDGDVASAFAFICRIMHLNPLDRESVTVIEVSGGKTIWDYDKEFLPEQDDLVIHLGTGGYFSAEHLVFDQNANDFPFWTLTECIYQYFYLPEMTRAKMQNMLMMVNHIYGGVRRFAVVESVCEALEAHYQDVCDQIGEVIRFEWNHLAPYHFIMAIENMPKFMRAVQIVKIGYVLIEGFFSALSINKGFQYLTDDAEEVEKDGLMFALIGSDSNESQRLRGYVNQWKKHWDVFISSNPERPTIGITITNECGHVSGMRRLVEVLREMVAKVIGREPLEEEVFIHQNDFVIYINGDFGITPEEVFALAQEHLSRSGEMNKYRNRN